MPTPLGAAAITSFTQTASGRRAVQVAPEEDPFPRPKGESVTAPSETRLLLGTLAEHEALTLTNL